MWHRAAFSLRRSVLDCPHSRAMTGKSASCVARIGRLKHEREWPGKALDIGHVRDDAGCGPPQVQLTRLFGLPSLRSCPAESGHRADTAIVGQYCGVERTGSSAFADDDGT